MSKYRIGDAVLVKHPCADTLGEVIAIDSLGFPVVQLYHFWDASRPRLDESAIMRIPGEPYATVVGRFEILPRRWWDIFGFWPRKVVRFNDANGDHQ